LFFFFFNDTAPTETSPLSLPDALPIYFAVSEPFLSAMSCAKLPSNTISPPRSEEHTSELQSRENLVCRLLLEKKKIAVARVVADEQIGGGGSGRSDVNPGRGERLADGHRPRLFFFFNDPAATEIYPLPLHDALPISARPMRASAARPGRCSGARATAASRGRR